MRTYHFTFTRFTLSVAFGKGAYSTPTTEWAEMGELQRLTDCATVEIAVLDNATGGFVPPSEVPDFTYTDTPVEDPNDDVFAYVDRSVLALWLDALEQKHGKPRVSVLGG